MAHLRILWPWLPLGSGYGAWLTALALLVPTLLLASACVVVPSTGWLLAFWFLTLTAASARAVRDHHLDRLLNRRGGLAPGQTRLDTGAAFAPLATAPVICLRVCALICFFVWLGEAAAVNAPTTDAHVIFVVLAIVDAIVALLDEGARLDLVSNGGGDAADFIGAALHVQLQAAPSARHSFLHAWTVTGRGAVVAAAANSDAQVIRLESGEDDGDSMF